MSLHRLHKGGGHPETGEVREHAEALARELYDTKRELDVLRDELEVRGAVLSYAVKRWLEAEAQRDRARDLAASLAAKQPVRPVPESLMEAVLGAQAGCWYEGPGGA